MLVFLGLSGMGLARSSQRLLTTAGLKVSDPFTLISISLLITLLLLGAWMLARREIPRGRPLWLFSFPLGMVNVAIPAVGFTLGQQHLSTGAAGLFVAAVPVAVAAMASVALGEKLSWRGWAGLMLSAGAVSSLAFASQGGSTALIGLAWSGLAVGAAAWSYVMMRKSGKTFGVVQLLFAQICWSAAVLVPLAFFLGHPTNITVSGVTVLMLVGLAASNFLVPQLLAIHMVRLTDASKVAVANYAVPALTALLAWGIFSEAPSLGLVAAGSAAVLGAWIVNRDRFSFSEPTAEAKSRYRYHPLPTPPLRSQPVADYASGSKALPRDKVKS